MAIFEEMFKASKGQPITYMGKTLVMVDLLPIVDGEKLKVVFEHTESKWRQGVMLRIRGGGELIVDGLVCKLPVLWEDTAPKEVPIVVKVKKSNNLEIKNIWDTGDGVIQSWHNGAAMIVQLTDNGRRYLCNDGQPDDDFNDIIFRVERVVD